MDAPPSEPNLHPQTTGSRLLHQPARRPTFRFMELLEELRHCVFEYLLVNDHGLEPRLCSHQEKGVVKFHNNMCSSKNVTSVLNTLTFVSRQFSNEAKRAFYGSNVFHSCPDLPIYFDHLKNLGRLSLVHIVNFHTQFNGQLDAVPDTLCGVLHTMYLQIQYEKKFRAAHGGFNRLAAAKHKKDIRPVPPDIKKSPLFETGGFPLSVITAMLPFATPLELTPEERNRMPSCTHQLVLCAKKNILQIHPRLAWLPRVLRALRIQLKLVEHEGGDPHAHTRTFFPFQWRLKYQKEVASHVQKERAAADLGLHKLVANAIRVCPAIKDTPFRNAHFRRVTCAYLHGEIYAPMEWYDFKYPSAYLKKRAAQVDKTTDTERVIASSADADGVNSPSSQA